MQYSIIKIYRDYEDIPVKEAIKGILRYLFNKDGTVNYYTDEEINCDFDALPYRNVPNLQMVVLTRKGNQFTIDFNDRGNAVYTASGTYEEMLLEFNSNVFKKVFRDLPDLSR